MTTPKILAGLCFVLLTLAACGGGSSKSNTASNPNNALNPGANSGGGSASSSSGSSDLSTLLSNAAKARFKVTYQEGSDTLTVEQDGNGDSVYATADSRTIVKPGQTIACQDTNTSTPKCTLIPSAGAASGAAGFASIFNGLTAAIKAKVETLGGHISESSDTIAGRSARCVNVTGSFTGEGKGGTLCVDKDSGVLLKVESIDASGNKKTDILATSYGEPSDNDFTPPATPETIPTP